MTHILSHLIFLFLLISLASFGQKKPSPEDHFFNWLNNYQKDSLRNLLAEDFLLRRTYTTYFNDKSSFLDKYIPDSKAYNGKYKILKVITDIEPRQFLVEDQSDYLKYLNVGYPTWNITLMVKDEKIQQVIIDTTEAYQKYLEEIKVADEKFMTWLKFNYPGDTREILNNQEGLLVKRLIEYAGNRE